MIHFVGAGPGAADLITVRGARLLGEADLVIWCGSLVSPELIGHCRPDARVLDSSALTLAEIVHEMVEADRSGLCCVRLQTGDPALFGALAEQTRALDEAGVAWEVVPGVSSVFGVSAALGIEYTVPGLTQTLIVTRVAGRTPVPAAEELRALAAHKTSLAILLSATLAGDVERELLAAGLAPSTPAAVVKDATWEGERCLRCTVGSLARCMREHGVDGRATIVVGEALSAQGARSRLYDPTFSHAFRTGTREEPCA